ncbi:IS3 family transposase [Nocardia sp. NPDC059239]|uniref:IS3 family transposase n=1 Tax=Nocardia sp. NPDC059239 TaxID=3346785 RepID=UPI00369B9066
MNRSTFQFHRSCPVPTRPVRRIVVADAIEEIHCRSRGIYGKRRIRAALLVEHDMIVNLKLVEAIMRERGLSGLPRKRRRKPSLLRLDTPSDLVQRRFTADRPNQLWVTDITEHPATAKCTAARSWTRSAK